MSRTLVIASIVLQFLWFCVADITEPFFSRCASPGISTLPTNSVFRYVSSSSGSDSNSGTSLSSAWASLSHAASSVSAGTTVYVLGGTYAERLTFSTSGTATGWIIFVNYANERPIIDGSTLTVSTSGNDALVTFNSGTAYIALVGFEIAHFSTSSASALPLGIWIASSGSTTIHDILIRNNTIHHIQNHGTSSSTNAFGMAVYGQTSTPITRITFDYNEIHDTITGQSETCTFNGNVDGFVAAYNYIHDVNNIGLDAIGAEGTAPTNDVARNGIFFGNIVANISSNSNPTYAAGQISADGIYVDGGANILIDSNILVSNDIGIEIASEHSGHGAINCTAQNNLIWGGRQTGITIGGYDTNRGYAINITVQNNILWNNQYDSAGTGELNLNYDIRSMVVKGNTIFDSDPAGYGAALFISSPFTVDAGVVLSGNSYQAPSGLSPQWQWLSNQYSTLASWKAAINSDTGSTLTTTNAAGICAIIGGQWTCTNGQPVPVCPTLPAATTTTTAPSASTTTASTTTTSATTATTATTATVATAATTVLSSTTTASASTSSVTSSSVVTSSAVTSSTTTSSAASSASSTSSSSSSTTSSASSAASTSTVPIGANAMSAATSNYRSWAAIGITGIGIVIVCIGSMQIL